MRPKRSTAARTAVILRGVDDRQKLYSPSRPIPKNNAVSQNREVVRLCCRGDNSMVATEYTVGRSAVFEQLRRRLFSVAYRMTGTRADAEDIVQEAYLRWDRADTGEIRSPEAWLVSAVTR